MTFTLLMTSTLAWADQCSTLPADKAQQAYKIIDKFIKSNEIAVLDIYCEACRDDYPIAIVADSVDIKEFQVKGYKEVLINDKNVDLAYLYLNGENIAKMVGCKTMGVDQYL